jgi:predicted choloylglycine hydrolase
MVYKMAQHPKTAICFNLKSADANSAIKGLERKNRALICTVREQPETKLMWTSVGEYTPKVSSKFRWLEVSTRKGSIIDAKLEAKILADAKTLGLEAVEGGHTGLED